MSGEHVLWPLMPFETDKRYDGEMRFACGD
jgi:hypothetical protein